MSCYQETAMKRRSVNPSVLKISVKFQLKLQLHEVLTPKTPSYMTDKHVTPYRNFTVLMNTCLCDTSATMVMYSRERINLNLRYCQSCCSRKLTQHLCVCWVLLLSSTRVTETSRSFLWRPSCPRWCAWCVIISARWLKERSSSRWWRSHASSWPTYTASLKAAWVWVSANTQSLYTLSSRHGHFSVNGLGCRKTPVLAVCWKRVCAACGVSRSASATWTR